MLVQAFFRKPLGGLSFFEKGAGPYFGTGYRVVPVINLLIFQSSAE